MPPVYAMDLLGFGHSEKPGVSYTQYLWEAQIADFAVEVMGGVPLILAGNSIGGGLSAGAAASLKGLCRGLVLLNTAGALEDPDEYVPPPSKTHTEMAYEGNPESPYRPVPLLGRNGLDLFGTVVVRAVYPQIERRLSLIYANRPSNADPALIRSVQEGAASPGSPNVVGSGQKLAPNRPLNELLKEPHGFGGPVLVLTGADDRVSSPAVARRRAELFSRLRKGVDAVLVEEAGHCPHDETPDIVAEEVWRWFPDPEREG